MADVGGAESEITPGNMEGLDPDYEPSEKELLEYAEWLGIDAERDADLLWIARRGLKTPLPKPWKPCESDDGEVFYFNPQTGATTWDHPCDEELREIYRKEVAKKNGEPAERSSSKGGTEKAEKKEKKESKSRKGSAPRPPPAPTNTSAGPLGGSLPGPIAGLLGPLPPLSLPRSGSGGALPGVPPLLEPPAAAEALKAASSDDGDDLDDLFDLPLQLGSAANTSAAGSDTGSKQGTKNKALSSRGPVVSECDVSMIEESIIQEELYYDEVENVESENTHVKEKQQQEEKEESDDDKKRSTNAKPSSSTIVETVPPEDEVKSIGEPFSDSGSSQELASPPAHQSKVTEDCDEPKVGLGGMTPKGLFKASDLGNGPELSPLDDSGRSASLDLSGVVDLGLNSDSKRDGCDVPVAGSTSKREALPFNPETSSTCKASESSAGTALAVASSNTADAVSAALAKAGQQHKAQQDALEAAQAALKAELTQACKARDQNLASLKEIQVERDRLREGASNMTNTIAEVRRQRCLEEQRCREASDEREQLKVRLVKLEADLLARGRAEEEVRQLREECGSVSKEASERQAAATATADRLQEELRQARDELSAERASSRARAPSTSKDMCLGPRSRLEFDSPSPPTPQLASILVAELRPEEQISLWSPEEAVSAKPGPEDGDVVAAASPWSSTRGKGAVDHISGSGSLELSSLSAVLEQSHDDLGDGSMIEELRMPHEGRERSTVHFKQPESRTQQQSLHAHSQHQGRQQHGLPAGKNHNGGGSNVPTARPSPANTFDADALTTALSTIRLHKTPIAESTGTFALDVARSDGKSRDNQHKTANMHTAFHLEGESPLKREPINGAEGLATSEARPQHDAEKIMAGNPSAHGHDINITEKNLIRSTGAFPADVVLSLESQKVRNELAACELQLQEANTNLQREKSSHFETQASMRERAREVTAFKVQLDSKDADVQRSLAETQRCHDEIAGRDVEIHKLRVQLQAREAELGQMRAQWRIQTQQTDIALQRQRFELGEREQALADRERYLDERERLSGEVEVALHRQRRELQAKLHSIELGSLREVAAPLHVGGLAGDHRGRARHSASRKEGACDGPRSRSSTGRRAESHADTHRSRRPASSDGRAVALGSSDESLDPRRRADGATPSSASSNFSPPGAPAPEAFGTPGSAKAPAPAPGAAEAPAQGKRTVRELAEVLRNRRRELRSEHASLEEDRRRWRDEVRQLRSGSMTGRGDAKIPRSCSTARTALDERATELNKAIDEHRALERCLAGQLKQDRASPGVRSQSLAAGAVAGEATGVPVAGGPGRAGSSSLETVGSSGGKHTAHQQQPPPQRGMLRGEAGRANAGGA